jgi:hypothetical protein
VGSFSIVKFNYDSKIQSQPVCEYRSIPLFLPLALSLELGYRRLLAISSCTTTKVLKTNAKAKQQRKKNKMLKHSNRKLVRIELISIDIESWDLRIWQLPCY